MEYIKKIQISYYINICVYTTTTLQLYSYGIQYAESVTSNT